MNGLKDLKKRIELLKITLGFESLADEQLEEIADLSSIKIFKKGEIIFSQSEECLYFYVVADGLVKVSICSSSGIKITYLLAGRGEPLNLVGPFTGSPRFFSATAYEDATILLVKREDFLSFVFKYPNVITGIVSILGHAIDSANSRIIDMMEKRVEQRLLKVLYTLYKKFGPDLSFTSKDLAELAGTTTESTLRAMGKMRDLGILNTGRGRVTILDPDQLKDLGYETLWV